MKKLAILFAVGLFSFSAHAQINKINPSSMPVTPTGGTAGTLANKLQVDDTTITRGASGITVTGLVTPPTIDTGSGQVLTTQRGYHYITKNYCLASGAVGCWLMNGTTTESDLTSTAATLSMTGTVSRVSTVPTGYSGYSRQFSPTSYLTADVEGTALDINGANATMSMGAWVYYTGTIANTNGRAILSKYTTTGDQRQYYLQLYGTATNTFQFRALFSSTGTSATVTAATTTTNYVPNTWYHVVAVDDDTDVRVYVNGVLDSTPAAFTSGIFNGTALLSVGNRDSDTFSGYITNAFVTNTALASTDVAAIYNYGINGNNGGTTNLNTTTLPATVVGKTHCFRQETGLANPISITPPTSSYVEAQDGSAFCTVSHAIQSAGASGDAICYQAKDATHWMASGGAVGSWTCQ